jgi:hypothetical protein
MKRSLPKSLLLLVSLAPACGGYANPDIDSLREEHPGTYPAALSTYPTVTFGGLTTSGDQECAREGLACYQATDDGVSVGCSDVLAYSDGAAWCGRSRIGAPISFGGSTTSGDQECAGDAKGCRIAYNDGVRVSCADVLAFNDGVALCDYQASGVPVSVISTSTSGDQQCTTLMLSCERAYTDGVSVGCSDVVFFDNGVVVCTD